MIYTSYFGNLRKLPQEITPIAICRSVPAWYKGKRYPALAPTCQILQEWRAWHYEEAYRKNFGSILQALNPYTVVTELYALAESKDIALICYEKPGDFCHRHLVADWLMAYGIECREYVPV